MNDFKKIIGKKVLGVGHGVIYFEDGIELEFHEYEAYLGKYNARDLNKKRLRFYSPKLFQE